MVTNLLFLVAGKSSSVGISDETDKVNQEEVWARHFKPALNSGNSTIEEREL